MRSAGQISGLFTFNRELLGPSMIYRLTLGSYLRSTGQFWRVLYDLQVIFGGVSAFRRFILGPVHDLEVKFGVYLRSAGEIWGLYLRSTDEILGQPMIYRSISGLGLSAIFVLFFLSLWESIYDL